MQSMKSSKLYISIILLIAFLLGIKSLEELDIWIFLKTGAWIWQHQEIPTQDPFSFTYAGQPWTHIKWLYSLLVYGLERLTGGPEGMMWFQAVVNLGVAWILIQWSSKIKASWRTSIWHLVYFLSLWAWMEFRMNGRPENTSHWMILAYGYLFFIGQNKPHMAWWIIPLQLLWSNMHDAYPLGLIIGGVFCGSYFIKQKNLSWIALYICLVLSACINPLGVKSLTYAYEVFTQLNTNKFTPELFSFTYAEFWRHWQSWVYVCIAFIFNYLYLQEKSFKKGLWEPYYILSVLFLIMGFGAFRNLIFYVLWISPYLLTRINVSMTFYKTTEKAIWLTVSVLFIILLSSGSYYKMLLSRHQFGLFYSEQKQAALAADFFIQNKIPGPVFSDYLSSAYFLYQVPHFKTYLDLRDLDVFSPSFFQHYQDLCQDPNALDQELKKYSIQSVALYLKTPGQAHHYFYYHPYWNLAYVDHNMVIYQKEPRTDPKEALQQNTSPLLKKRCSPRHRALNKLFNLTWSEDIEPEQSTLYIQAKYIEWMQDQNTLLWFLNQNQNKQLMNLAFQNLYYKTLRSIAGQEEKANQIAQHIHMLQQHQP